MSHKNARNQNASGTSTTAATSSSPAMTSTAAIGATMRKNTAPIRNLTMMTGSINSANMSRIGSHVSQTSALIVSYSLESTYEGCREKFRRGPSALDAPPEFLGGWQRVLDETAADFLHRDPFELVGTRLNLPIEPRQGASAQLFGTLRSHVHEEKSTGDWDRGLRDL